MTLLTKNTAKLRAEIERHIAADAVVGGRRSYWFIGDNAVGGTGCFIGCLAHSGDVGFLESEYGLPQPLVRIAEHIFESLPESQRPVFFREVGEAVGHDGRDLTLVHWAFLADTVRHLPPQGPRIQEAIDPVIAGMDLLASGGVWPEDECRAAAYAARAAAYAAADARAAAYAAYAAAYAANAARAARDFAAEIERQRQAFLRIKKGQTNE